MSHVVTLIPEDGTGLEITGANIMRIQAWRLSTTILARLFWWQNFPIVGTRSRKVWIVVGHPTVIAEPNSQHPHLGAETEKVLQDHVRQHRIGAL